MGNQFFITIAAIAVFVGFVLLFLISKQSKGKAHSGGARGLSSENKELVKQKWQQIEVLLSSGKPSGFRSAVVDADKLLDFVLKQQGFRGETMGERLKSARGKFSNENAVWQAHKLRNIVVHEAEYELMHFEAPEAVAKFKQAVRDLGVDLK